MISEPNHSSDGKALAWAAEQLGVPPESPPEVCTKAFLRRLAEEDFVPPPRLKDAWQFAVRSTSEDRPALPWVDSAAEAELSGRIEEFASQFFNLPPEQRSTHWERLYADARRWPRLETRLQRLKPGLDIEFAPLPTLSLHEAKLIQWIRELFTLPMDQRAVRRRQMLRDDFGSEVRPWQRAAQQLRTQQRALAALAPDLLVPLSTWGQSAKAASRNTRMRNAAAARSGPTILSFLKVSKLVRRLPFVILGVCALIKLLEGKDYRSQFTPYSYTQPIQVNEQPEYERSKPPNEAKTSSSRFDSPPIDQPKPFDSKTWHEMLDAMEKNDQTLNRAPTPPPQSPSVDPLLPKVPGNPADTIPDKNFNEFLFPRNDSDSRPTPAAPAGQKR